MKILPNPRLRKRGMVGPMLALLVIVIGAVICWKIYKLAERLLPLPPPPPSAPSTNNTPTNFPATNCSVDAAWFVINDVNQATNDPFDVMYGLMPSGGGRNGLMYFGTPPVPVLAGGAFESVGVMLDTSNVLATIRAWYGVGPDQYQPNNAAHSEWVAQSDGSWAWVSTPATNLTHDQYSGLITVQAWTGAAGERQVVLQRTTNNVDWTNLWTNSMREGQFHLYRDTTRPESGAFYRTEMRQ